MGHDSERRTSRGNPFLASQRWGAMIERFEEVSTAFVGGITGGHCKVTATKAMVMLKRRSLPRRISYYLATDRVL